jgi:hypothetical protein
MKTNKIVFILLLLLLLAGCSLMGGQVTTIDQCIQYRAAFNSTLSSLTTNLASLPEPQRQKYASMAIPFAQAGMLALDLMDASVTSNGQIPPEAVQQYMASKNALIDLIAKMILEKGK